jgi:anti-sigma B factor antagonist
MADSITADLQNDGTLGIIRVSGYLNQTSGDELHKACTRLLADGVQDLLINLAECRIVNSVGMSCLIEVLEALAANGGRMAFCHATPTIGKTLRIMGLLLRATLHDTEAAALQALGEAVG